MESLDSSFEKVLTAVSESLQAFKTSLTEVHEQLKQHESKEQALKEGFKEGLKTIKDTSESQYIKKDEYNTLKTNFDAVTADIQILKKHELEEMEFLQSEVDELRSKLIKAEQSISEVKTRLEKMNVAVKRQVEMRRSMR